MLRKTLWTIAVTCSGAALSLAQGAHGQPLKGSRYADLPTNARSLVEASTLDVARKSGRLVLPLPDGSILRFVPTSIEVNAGVTTTRGQLGDARLLLTSDGQRAYGHATVDSKSYVIDTVGRVAVIADASRVSSPEVAYGTGIADVVIDVERSLRLLDNSRTNLEIARQRPSARAATAALEETVVDVAFFYEPEMADREGVQGPRTLAQAGVDYTNDAYRQHQLPLRLRLIYVGPYPGSLPFDPFYSFVDNAEINAIADAYGADLAHLLFDYRPGLRYCGIAFLFGRHGASAQGCNLNYVIAHEIGHNFGAQHDRANASLGWNIGLPIHQFNYGFVCGGRGSIMSYPGYPHLPHYSTPLLSNGGEACGLPEGDPNAADNARALDLTRAQVGAFRLEQQTFGTVRFASTASLQLDEAQARTAALRVVRSGDLSREASVEIGALDGTTTDREDYLPVLQRLVFAPNESEKSVTFEVIDDEEHEPAPETLQLVLRYPRGLAVDGGTVQVSIASDDPDRGRAEFLETGLGVWEDSGSVTLNLRRTGNTVNPLTVNLATRDETATAGVDYDALGTSVTFAPGESDRQVSVAIRDDDLYQGYQAYRTFLVQLSGANLGANRSLRVFIFNEDVRRGTVQFPAAQIVADENAGSVAILVDRVDGSEGPLTFNFSAQDGSAVAGRDYLATAGAITLGNGETSAFLPIQLIDNPRFDGNRSFRLDLSGDAVGTPGTLEVVIRNDDADRGLAQFAVSSIAVSEKSGNATVPIERIGGAEETLTVSYQTVTGTARAGEDFVATSGTVTFGPGERTRQVSVPIIDDDDLYDPGKTFKLTLSGVLLGTVTETTVAIENDDPNRGRAQFAAATASVGERAGSVTLTLQRVDGFDGDLAVTYATGDGSAKAGIDYTGSSGGVTFGGGESSKTISIPVIDNSLLDGSRSFVVDLQQGRLGSITRVTVTIADDERLGKAEFATPAVTVSEAAGTASLQVRRVDGSDGTLEVGYRTLEGTARAGTDFQAASGTLSFAAGETSKTVAVTIVNNTVVDAKRSFSVELSGAALAATKATVVTIENEDQPAKKSGGGAFGGASLALLLLAGLRSRLRRIQALKSNESPKDGGND
jgi:hypothetical protein